METLDGSELALEYTCVLHLSFAYIRWTKGYEEKAGI